jgi:DNA-binding Xre family transcriptional regulator
VARIVLQVRQLRLEYAHKIGRPVDQREVAQAVNVTEATLSKLERSTISRIDFETLVKLCDYYSVALGRVIEVGDVLRYDRNNTKTLGQIMALQP